MSDPKLIFVLSCYFAYILNVILVKASIINLYVDGSVVVDDGCFDDCCVDDGCVDVGCVDDGCVDDGCVDDGWDVVSCVDDGWDVDGCVDDGCVVVDCVDNDVDWSCVEVDLRGDVNWNTEKITIEVTPFLKKNPKSRVQRWAPIIIVWIS